MVELTSRGRMPLGGPEPIVGTYQGVWPGIQVMENGAAKAAPSGSPWIDTNTGFIRSVRAWGPAAVWLGYLPPPHSVITNERYQAAIADAEMAGARWIVALDSDLSARLGRGDAAATATWRRMAQVLDFFESHPDWRELRSYGKLAVVQDHDDALLSGGILDMIAAKHTPMRAIPGQRLTPEALEGATMAVDVDADSLTPEQREMLKNFARAGGTVLTAPPGWKGQSALNSGPRLTWRSSSARPRNPTTPPSVAERPSRKAAQRQVDRMKKALDELARVEAAKAEQKQKPTKNNAAKASTTDPDARFLRMPDGGNRPAYNVQLAVDTDSRAVVGVDVTNAGSDAGLAEPMRDQVEEQTGGTVEEQLLDGGYVRLEDLDRAAGEHAPVTLTMPVPKPRKPSRPV